MDLQTRYLGLTLRSPLVASAGPLTGSLGGITRLAEAGVGAIVLPSLFEEQVSADAERNRPLADVGAERQSGAQTYFRDSGGPGRGTGRAGIWP